MREPQHRENLLLHLPLLVCLEPAVEETRGRGRRRLLRVARTPASPQQRTPAGGGGGQQGRPERRGPAAAAQQPPPPAQPLRPPPQPRHPRGPREAWSSGARPERGRCGPWREQPPPPLGGLASPSWPSVLISHDPLGRPQLPRMQGRRRGPENRTPALVSRSARSRPGASESRLLCSRRP